MTEQGRVGKGIEGIEEEGEGSRGAREFYRR
jgi:hypothetical protein